jgi:hypothetical protein
MISQHDATEAWRKVLSICRVLNGIEDAKYRISSLISADKPGSSLKYERKSGFLKILIRVRTAFYFIIVDADNLDDVQRILNFYGFKSTAPGGKL